MKAATDVGASLTPMCPQCGRQWRWMHWYWHLKYRYYKQGTHPHGEPQCDPRWHDEIIWRGRTNNPLPIPDGRKVLGSPDERQSTPYPTTLPTAPRQAHDVEPLRSTQAGQDHPTRTAHGAFGDTVGAPGPPKALSHRCPRARPTNGHYKIKANGKLRLV